MPDQTQIGSQAEPQDLNDDGERPSGDSQEAAENPSRGTARRDPPAEGIQTVRHLQQCDAPTPFLADAVARPLTGDSSRRFSRNVYRKSTEVAQPAT
jgi:hypothetical protein